MLKQWICATTGRVVFTPKGRAYNIASPALGTTANAALLSVIYAQLRSPYVPAAKAERYTCFARAQVCLLHASLLSGGRGCDGCRAPPRTLGRAALLGALFCMPTGTWSDGATSDCLLQSCVDRMHAWRVRRAC